MWMPEEELVDAANWRSPLQSAAIDGELRATKQLAQGFNWRSGMRILACVAIVMSSVHMMRGFVQQLKTAVVQDKGSVRSWLDAFATLVRAGRLKNCEHPHVV